MSEMNLAMPNVVWDGCELESAIVDESSEVLTLSFDGRRDLELDVEIDEYDIVVKTAVDDSFFESQLGQGLRNAGVSFDTRV